MKKVKLKTKIKAVDELALRLEDCELISIKTLSDELKMFFDKVNPESGKIDFNFLMDINQEMLESNYKNLAHTYRLIFEAELKYGYLCFRYTEDNEGFKVISSGKKFDPESFCYKCLERINYSNVSFSFYVPYEICFREGL